VRFSGVHRKQITAVHLEREAFEQVKLKPLFSDLGFHSLSRPGISFSRLSSFAAARGELDCGMRILCPDQAGPHAVRPGTL
jgi:hypothetical protein